MVEVLDNILHEKCAIGFENLLRKRVKEATPVKLLSAHDKVVEVVEDINGRRFVRRIYHKEALDDIGIGGLDFDEAWEGMHKMFAKANIRIVPSFVLKDGGVITVVSEYLEGAKALSESSLESKKHVARGLGELIHSSPHYLPTGAMLQRDMFHVVEDSAGTERVYLTDVDPYVFPRRGMDRLKWIKDSSYADYMTLVGGLFWDDWCREDEREPVFSALIVGLGRLHDEFESGEGMRSMMAFSNLLMMKSGIRPEID